MKSRGELMGFYEEGKAGMMGICPIIPPGASGCLFAHEQRVERDGFRQGHSKNALNENLDRRAGIAANSFDSLGADKTDAEGGAEAAERSLNASSDFSEYVHGIVIVWLFFLGPPSAQFGTVPAEILWF
jgi:hypothetical protein